MYLTGFADEAASDLPGQIRATQELGWRWIESRAVDGTNLHNLSDQAFAVVCDQLQAAGIGVNCFGSALANWSKDITKPFADDWAEAQRAAERMRRLDCTQIRVMSWPILAGRGPQDQLVDERVRRLREFVALFAAQGATVLHENCHNYGGMGADFTLRLLDQIPDLKLVFDTGNPVFTDDYGMAEPRAKQSSWDFYRQVREHVAYVHIKDGVWDPVPAAAGVNGHTWPGEGQGDVRAVVKDLLARGYDGGFSMEPHLVVVAHDPRFTAPEQIKFANYVAYGQRFMRLLADLGRVVKS